MGHVHLVQKEQLVLIQRLRGNRLGRRAFGKARSPAGDVIGHAELQVGLAEGSHDAISSGRSKKVTHSQRKGLSLIVVPGVLLWLLPVVLAVEVYC